MGAWGVCLARNFLIAVPASCCAALQGQEKMSKSDPNSAIFMEDSAAEVKTKIKKAFCPPEQASMHAICPQWLCETSKRCSTTS